MKKRFEELAQRSYNQGIYFFTDFLSLSEASVICETFPEKDYALFGGAAGCERVMARFGNPDDIGYEQEFPIRVIKIEPLVRKFSDELNHRDFLGALMNLGIERDVTGDIMIRNNTAYVFAAERIADYIAQSLDRIKHTSVKCICIGTDEIKEPFAANLQKEEIIVPSERLDVIISKLYNMSRSQTNEIFRERKVFVNGRLCENNSMVIAEKDIAAVRGHGKFMYGGVKHITKKGRFSVEINRYV